MRDDPILRCHTCKQALRALTVCAWCCRPAHRGCWDGRGCGVCLTETRTMADRLADLERVVAQ